MDLGQILISTFDRLDPNLMPCDAAFSDVSLGPDGLPLVTPFSIVYIHHECRHSSPYCHVASVVIECGYATKMQCMLCKASYCSSLFGASGRVQSEAAQTWCGLKGPRAPSGSARRTSAANAGVGPVQTNRSDVPNKRAAKARRAGSDQLEEETANTPNRHPAMFAELTVAPHHDHRGHSS